MCRRHHLPGRRRRSPEMTSGESQSSEQLGRAAREHRENRSHGHRRDTAPWQAAEAWEPSRLFLALVQSSIQMDKPRDRGWGERPRLGRAAMGGLGRSPGAQPCHQGPRPRPPTASSPGDCDGRGGRTVREAAREETGSCETRRRGGAPRRPWTAGRTDTWPRAS